ncbi:GNAT family N-acetyltransferase [Sphingomonas sp. KR3-1]|uniref:GNAT family N-acetyltransferase n=1 Tax=Sphingomonas sp. KR3-1 TaxID=3156611 RepID=UPI0032B55513
MPLDDAPLRSAGIRLRAAEQHDLPALARLHALWRMPELLVAPWSAAQKQAFLDEQFALQHAHYVRHFARADFWVIVEGGAHAPVCGQLYLDRSQAEWRQIAVLLGPDLRGRGVGSAILRWIQHAATAAGATGITLHVGITNPQAQALYRRLGFVDLPGGDGSNLPMRWTP